MNRMHAAMAFGASLFVIGVCLSTCSADHAQNIDAPPVEYRGEIFRPSQALADWFENLERRNPSPGEPISCCDAGDAYPIVILQEATIDGNEPDGIAEVTEAGERMIIKPNEGYKWRPEWKSPRRFHFAGNLITRELDGNPTKTAWVFANIDPLTGTVTRLYCVVPLPPAF